MRCQRGSDGDPLMGWNLSNIAVLSSIIAEYVGGLRVIPSATIDEVGGRSVTDEVWDEV